MDILELCKNKKTLLLTIGDSWTFGDSMLGEKEHYLKSPAGQHHRKKHIWGRHLSDQLDYDWLNIAEPGISNKTMVDYLDYFKNTKKYHRYKHIFAVIVLTETGRELEQLDWKNHRQELQTSEQKIYNAIKKHTDEKMSLTVARNFTVNYKRTQVPRNIKFVVKNWQSVLLESQCIQPVDVRGPASGVALWIYENYNPSVVKNPAYKQFVIDTVDSAQPLWDAMDASKLNYSRATRHPTEQGHRIWADYLYDNYFQNN